MRTNAWSLPTQVFHRRSLAFLMTHIGTFKIDIATVYKQPGAGAALAGLSENRILLWKHLLTCCSPPADHRFLKKWAPLTDPADTRSGLKGFVKATLTVLMKGDSLSMPSLPSTPSSGSGDDIEKSVGKTQCS